MSKVSCTYENAHDNLSSKIENNICITFYISITQKYFLVRKIIFLILDKKYVRVRTYVGHFVELVAQIRTYSCACCANV